MLSRREFLTAAMLAPAFRQPSSARRAGILPLGNPSGARTAPLGTLLGSGLSARQFTDLSTLSPDDPATLITSTDRFFVRTAAPAALPDSAGWTIEVGGQVQAPVRIALDSLTAEARAVGPFVMECSGNADPANYGLLSAARWAGIPVLAMLDRARAASPNHRVLIAGVDDPTDPGRTSVPGASWIFSRDQLARAVIATRMNGAPLPRHHGAPARLVIPGWYGCACIKWVNRIELVAEDAPATTQMREYAGRTHQPFATASADAPVPPARDFIPATMDTAAMPVRIEKWIDGRRVFYRIVGVMWGGEKPTNALAIRFRANQAWTRVEHCPLPASTDSWTVWTHTWHPAEPGRYDIVLKVDDPSIRTRRLDIFFYTRAVNIDQI